MFNVLGSKAIDLKRRDPNYVIEEERVKSGKVRNGIIAGGIVLGFVASILKTAGSLASRNK